MKGIIFVSLAWVFSLPIVAQRMDSLVLFSDLKYHSGFEKQAIHNYLKTQSDTLDLFLAIDSSMTKELAWAYKAIYQKMLKELYEKRIEEKKIAKRIRKSFISLHSKYLNKYKEIEFFPSLFKNGTYNCVTSTILYAMVFNEFRISYKVQVTRNHVYLVANPGPSSIVVETTKPYLYKPKVLDAYKKNYISRLRSQKIISEYEFNNKSIEELFEEKTTFVRTTSFNSLIGIQYYNLGLVEFSNKKVERSYELFQKAYFFNPDKQAELVLFGALLQLIGSSKFEKPSDIDYLVHLSRFDEIDFEITKELLLEVLEYHLQYTDRLEYCDAIYKRFISHKGNNFQQEEMDFEFNLFMAKHLKGTIEQKKYVERLINSRQNHKEANCLFKGYVNYSLKLIGDYEKRLHTIKDYRENYPYDFMKDLLFENELITHLNQAQELFKYNYIEDGEIYLQKFEKLAPKPIRTNNKELIKSIENAYRALAIYYYYFEGRKKALLAVNRGLYYVPGSRYLQSAVY